MNEQKTQASKPRDGKPKVREILSSLVLSGSLAVSGCGDDGTAVGGVTDIPQDVPVQGEELPDVFVAEVSSPDDAATDEGSPNDIPVQTDDGVPTDLPNPPEDDGPPTP